MQNSDIYSLTFHKPTFLTLQETNQTSFNMQVTIGGDCKKYPCKANDQLFVQKQPFLVKIQHSSCLTCVIQLFDHSNQIILKSNIRLQGSDYQISCNHEQIKGVLTFSLNISKVQQNNMEILEKNKSAKRSEQIEVTKGQLQNHQPALEQEGVLSEHYDQEQFENVMLNTKQQNLFQLSVTQKQMQQKSAQLDNSALINSKKFNVLNTQNYSKNLNRIQQPDILHRQVESHPDTILLPLLNDHEPQIQGSTIQSEFLKRKSSQKGFEQQTLIVKTSTSRSIAKQRQKVEGINEIQNIMKEAKATVDQTKNQTVTQNQIYEMVQRQLERIEKVCLKHIHEEDRQNVFVSSKTQQKSDKSNLLESKLISNVQANSFHVEIDNKLTKQKNTVSAHDSSIEQSRSIAGIHKSRISQIAHQMKSRFGDQIFQNKSATTLQKSIHSYSVPKALRFTETKYEGGEPHYNLKTIFENSGNKGTSFGFGKRRQFPQWLERNNKQFPAPNTYLQNRPSFQTIKSPKGYSFGIPYSYYKKVTILGDQNSKKIPSVNLPKVDSSGRLYLKKELQMLKTTMKMPKLSEHYHFARQPR